jgi:hypothetical protein
VQTLEVEYVDKISDVRKVNKKKQISRYSMNKNIKDENFKKFNRTSLNYKNLLKKYLKITDLHKKEDYDKMLVSSMEFINLILEKISQQIGFNYKDLNDFLESITKMNLKNKFILYNEIEILATLLHNNKKAGGQFEPNILTSVLSIIKKIMEKIKIPYKRNNDNSFSNGYDEFKTNSIKKRSRLSIVKALDNNINESESQLNTTTEIDDFSKLESFIDELFKLQKQNK